jgi:hypothetical protein
MPLYQIRQVVSSSKFGLLRMTQRKLLPAGVALYYVAHKLASYNPGHKPRSYNPVKLWPGCRGRPVGPGSCSRPLE